METAQKKLYRWPEDRIIAGVCSGIARYFDTDPVLVRAIFVLLALINGIGVILYLILLMIMPATYRSRATWPAKPLSEEVVREKRAMTLKARKQLQNKRNIIGLVIILIGFLLLLSQKITINFLRWDLMWPSLIIIIGFYILFKPSDRYDK